MAMTSNVVGGINLVTLLLSIPIIATGVYLSTNPDTLCFNPLHWPIILLGVVMLSVSIAGCVAAFCRVSWLLVLYLVAMLLLIVLSLCLASFMYIVTFKGSGAGQHAPESLFLEYRLDHYSEWMRQRVMTSSKWDRIKTCLVSTDICSDLRTRIFPSPQSFFGSHLSPLQSGCCKPPTRCGFSFVTPTYWMNPRNPTVDKDCLLWSNGESDLCYACGSCKAGLLGSVRREWRRAELVLIVTLALLISVYLGGCVAYRSAKTEELFRRYKQGYT